MKQRLLRSKWITNRNEISQLYQHTPEAKELPQILFYLNVWRSMAGRLRMIHVGLGVSATFFTLLAASQIGFINNEVARIFAFLGAFSVALMTAFSIVTKANVTLSAFRHLNGAVMAYNNNQKSKEEVIRAWEEGEEKIGGVSYQSIR